MRKQIYFLNARVTFCPHNLLIFKLNTAILNLQTTNTISNHFIFKFEQPSIKIMQPLEEKYKNYILFAITLCIICLSLLSRLLQEGMFFDGIIYASISRNMAIGNGSFWKPFYTTSFYEHPPLMFGLQSFLYRLFGDHYLIEKLYCFIIVVITSYLIIALWKLANNDETSFKHSYWLPLLLWYLMPTVYWGSVVNLLDNTLGTFTLFAVYIKYYSLIKNRKVYLGSIISVFFILMGFLVKGPTSLFPLSVSILFYISYKKLSLFKTMCISLFEIVLFALLLSTLLLYQPAHDFILRYFNQQVLLSLEGKREVVESSLKHFQVLAEIAMQSIPAILIGLLALIFYKKKKHKSFAYSYQKNHFIFFLLLGLCASLPIMISIKQRSFYLLPALPYFALAFGFILIPLIIILIQNILFNLKRFKIVLMTILILAFIGIAFSFSRINTIGRDEVVLNDLKKFDSYLKSQKQIYISDQISNDWRLFAYLQRYYKITSVNKLSDSIPIMDFKNTNIKIPLGYSKIEGNNYVLFIKKE
jgi:4-amino-4-deoxy-L-arabinose transferase-like glycosyltransferase